jgi:hypothetical protein
LLQRSLRPGVAYIAGDNAVIALGEPAATEFSVQLPQAPQLTVSTDALLADVFLQQFRTQGSAEVKALLSTDE